MAEKKEKENKRGAGKKAKPLSPRAAATDKKSAGRKKAGSSESINTQDPLFNQEFAYSAQATAGMSAQGKPKKAVKKKPQKGKKVPAAKRQEDKENDSSLIGGFFYSIGFYAEVVLVRVGRLLRDAGIFTAQVFSLLFSGAGRALGGFFRGLLQDITAPISKIGAEAQKSRRKGREAAQKAKEPRKAKDYALVLVRLGRICLPILAGVVLVFTVQTLLGRKYALAVEVNGTVIGYVADETVLDDAQNLLQMKLSLSEGQSATDWTFTPTLTISNVSTLSNKTQIADRILESSSEDIQQAKGIYVDDVPIGAIVDGQQLDDYLESLKAEYPVPALEGVEVESSTVDFVRDVEVKEQEEVFLTKSVKNFDEWKELLSTEVSSAVTHTSEKYETLSSIAFSYGITVSELRAKNPQYADQADSYEPEVGSEIIIRSAEPYLQIQVSYRGSVEEEIPIEEQIVEDSALPLNRKSVSQKGKAGVRVVPVDYVYIDGGEESMIRREEEAYVKEEMVPRIIHLGTNSSGSVVGDGLAKGFIFPLPDVHYSARGYSSGHRGLDISAAEGSVIIAADGGTVVYSGWRGMYGYCVEIDHGNGFRTLYGHCREVLVAQGSLVSQGQPIAIIGNTGNSFGRHLHFEVISEGVRIDPDPFLIWPATFTPPWKRS
ncbi:MAG: peptidoglycan DD-metalloendopeptidase family protein [Oscillospiraceae bacterium]